MVNFEHLTQEIQEEIQLFIDASEAYYNTDESIISDVEFDKLRETLLSYDIDEVSEFVKNSIQTEDGLINASEVTSQMISLNKIKYEGRQTISEILKFLNPGNVSLWVGPKLDGMAIKIKLIPLDINDDILLPRKINQILTRGGLDVTNELKNHPDFQIKSFAGNIIHGELVVSKEVFHKKYSEEVTDNELKKYKNPRNAVKGILSVNPLDLNFVACTDGISPLWAQKYSIWEKIENINDLHAIESKHKLNKEDSFQYQTDGLVIGYEVSKQIIKENYPMNLVAIKFKAPTAHAQNV